MTTKSLLIAWLVFQVLFGFSQGQNFTPSQETAPSRNNITMVGYAAAVIDNTEHWTTRSRNSFHGGALKFRNIFKTSYAKNGQSVRQNRYHGGMVPITRVADLTTAIQETTQFARTQIGDPNIKVNNLGIFTHGLNHALNFGGGNSINLNNVGEFVRTIDPYLANDAIIVLYACLTGSNQPYSNSDNLSGGDGSFADVLRDHLNANGTNREVWAHRSRGHFSFNPTWRVFSGQQTNSRAAEEELYTVDGETVASNVRNQIANQVFARISNATINEVKKYISMMMPYVDCARPFTYRDGENIFIYPDIINWYVNYWPTYNKINQ